MSMLIAFFTSKLGRVVALAAMLAIALGVAFYKGYSHAADHYQALWLQEKNARDADTLRHVTESAELNAALTKVIAEKREQVRTVTKTIIREVPKYVTQTADTKCVVPVGFVQLHDAAVRGETLPDSPSGAVDAPSGVALSEVASTVADNYGTYQEIRQQLIGWQTWYAQQSKEFASVSATPARQETAPSKRVGFSLSPK